MTPLPTDPRALDAAARAALGSELYAYVAGAAEDEATLAANAAAWTALRLRPRVLRDVDEIDTRTDALGAALAGPIGVAPMGMQLSAHPEGATATVRGAAAAGALAVIPMYGAGSATKAAAAAPDDAVLWLQVYMLADRERTLASVQRCVAAGYRAVVLTVDVARPGNRPAEVRQQVMEIDPGTGRPVDPSQLFDRALTPDDVARIAERCGVPLLVKGVLRGDDAVACIDAGAAGVVVSNHGGRQLDGALASADALAEIVPAVAGRGAVWVDGGVRRGRHVLSALALGAGGVLVGRPAFWGLALGGADGVAQVLGTLRDELERAMALCGVRRLDEVDRDLLAAST